MSDQSPLLIPMILEALVVNDHVRAPKNKIETFFRTQMDYNTIQSCGNAQPFLSENDAAFTRSDDVNGVPPSQYYNGVYLKWRLPKAFTRGTQDNARGVTTYPLVPNRWMVIRHSGALTARQATAWIIESDYIYTQDPGTPTNISQQPSRYLQPHATYPTMPVGVLMGRNLQLGSWSESGASIKLTAMGPGDPAFASYQPHCNNVFSFVDPLNGTEDQTLSYQVLGWFSSSEDDPLYPGSSDVTSFFNAQLEALSWSLPAGTDSALTASWSLLVGTINGVAWQSSTRPAGGTPDDTNTPVSVAVGNTSIEALTALITAQASGDNAVHPELLEAFQLNLLDTLDQPDGSALLTEKLRASFFQRHHGGYSWVIVDAPDSTAQVSPSELTNEAAWLATLNQNQHALDQAQVELESLQRQLYLLWWKYLNWFHAYRGSSKIPCLDNSQTFTEQLDPTNNGSLAWQVQQKQNSLASLQTLVPSGATPDALEQAIQDFATSQQLPGTRQLKRILEDPFYQPNNPVVLLSGSGSSGIIAPPDPIECRFPSQIVTGFVFNNQNITAATQGITIPQPDLSGISGAPWQSSLIGSLVSEFYFLDPNNGATIAQAIGASSSDVESAIAAAAIGTHPDSQFQQWLNWTENPWRPLLLIWDGFYYPIQYGTPQQPNWNFEGSQYTWNKNQASVVTPCLGLRGFSLLTPTASFNMESRINQFLKSNPLLPADQTKALQDLLNFVQTNDEWDLLSQPLDGFNEQLQLGMPGVFLDVGGDTVNTAGSGKLSPSLSSLIGSVGSYPPMMPPIPNKRQGVPTSQFQPWRSGQFEFQDLLLVDEWGQALWPFNPNTYKTNTVYLPADLTPEANVLENSSDPFIQLVPALLQPAKLIFKLVSVTDDNKDYGPAHPDADPIAGWILPNHLDSSLMAYEAQGDLLGELSIGVSGSGDSQVFWTPAPGSSYATTADVDIPHFGPFLQALASKTPAVVKDFLAAIDETLWTIQPTGADFDQSLAILIGRPLALVRARLQFQLQGEPHADPSWANTFDPSDCSKLAPGGSEVTSYEFGIQLGNVAQFNDGLVGYFVADNYDTCNVVTESEAKPDGYLASIGSNNNYLYQPFDDTTQTFVSMLVDPRAPVHATTAILPDVSVALPPNSTQNALAGMKVTFRVNGALTDQEMPASDENVETILTAVPKTKVGSWSWLEQDSNGWAAYPTGPNDTRARLTDVAPVLRRGLLQLASALAPPQANNSTLHTQKEK